MGTNNLDRLRTKILHIFSWLYIKEHFELPIKMFSISIPSSQQEVEAQHPYLCFIKVFFCT